MPTSRKVVLYIAMSLDGYIAQPGDDLSFLSVVAKEGEDYGYADFVSTIDTVILGRRTYEWVVNQVEFPHSDKNAYVLTRTERPPQGKTVFYTGDLEALIRQLKAETGKDIFCDGGAEVVTALLEKDLIDRFIISVIPILTGAGIRLFKEGRPEQKLRLTEVKSYDTGLVQLHYERDRGGEGA